MELRGEQEPRSRHSLRRVRIIQIYNGTPRCEQDPRSRYSLCGVRMENIQVKSFYKEYLYCIKSFKLK